MSTQIFKKQIPNDTFIALLEDIALKTEKYYIVNNESYKRGLFTTSIPTFIEYCKPFYHISKQKYLERKLTYNSFTTILRQICNFNKMKYTSQIKYDKSNYDIIYYIYF
jgi:hypothetical protein|uniref:Uncharacterized protein n=1 Tax=viral metagenome TaxID=1070528 RepID=A0A6C0HC84_9ZZZZ